MLIASERQGGFSLIEVLVALFVLSIGLLGLAALQTTGLKFNHQSYQRTQAVIQAYDIIDRMRHNTVGKNGGSYNTIALGAKPSISGINCTSGTGCVPADLATFDINQWNTGNEQLLSQGKGAVCRGTFNSTLTTCTSGGSVFKVGLTWIENDLPQYLIVEAQP